MIIRSKLNKCKEKYSELRDKRLYFIKFHAITIYFNFEIEKNLSIKFNISIKKSYFLVILLKFFFLVRLKFYFEFKYQL